MAIRWDWLEPLLTVPFVPALGPIHPAAITPGLFADVTAIAGTGRFLPHDKDARWGGRKDEHVLAGAITQEPGLVLIPTLSARRASCVKVHVYSQDPRGARSFEEGVPESELSIPSRRSSSASLSASARSRAASRPARSSPISASFAPAPPAAARSQHAARRRHQARAHRARAAGSHSHRQRSNRRTPNRTPRARATT